MFEQVGAVVGSHRVHDRRTPRTPLKTQYRSLTEAGTDKLVSAVRFQHGLACENSGAHVVRRCGTIAARQPQVKGGGEAKSDRVAVG
jgi:hypothetical protein